MKHAHINCFGIFIIFLTVIFFTACNRYTIPGCNYDKKSQGLLISLYSLDNKHTIDPFKNKNYKGFILIQKMISNHHYEPSEKPLETLNGKTEFFDNKGIIETQNYNYPSAINNFNKSISNNAKYPYSYNNIAVAYILKDDVDNAVSFLTKALSLCSKDPALYNNLGIVNYLKKDYNKSICYFKKAILIDPDNVYYYNNLALVYQSNGDPQSALNNYYIALTFQPDLKLIKNNYLNLKSTLQKSNISLKDYSEAIFAPDIINKHKHKHYESYNYSITTKDELKFKQVWRKINKKPAKDAWQFNDTGISFTMKENYNKAIESFLQAIKADPNYPESYNNLAIVYLLKNEAYPAEDSFTKSLSLDSQIPEFYLNLGAINILNNNYDKALLYLHHALKYDNMDPCIYNNLGILFESIGNYNIAYAMYHRALYIVSREKNIYKRMKNAQLKIDLPDTCDTEKFCQ